LYKYPGKNDKLILPGYLLTWLVERIKMKLNEKQPA